MVTFIIALVLVGIPFWLLAKTLDFFTQLKEDRAYEHAIKNPDFSRVAPEYMDNAIQLAAEQRQAWEEEKRNKMQAETHNLKKFFINYLKCAAIFILLCFLLPTLYFLIWH